jgi:hypothetical protein
VAGVEIANCTSSVLCTSANSSQCTSCSDGFYLVHGVVDQCTRT